MPRTFDITTESGVCAFVYRVLKRSIRERDYAEDFAPFPEGFVPDTKWQDMVKRIEREIEDTFQDYAPCFYITIYADNYSDNQGLTVEIDYKFETDSLLSHWKKRSNGGSA